jgi:hypothetical protein
MQATPLKGCQSRATPYQVFLVKVPRPQVDSKFGYIETTSKVGFQYTLKSLRSV